MLNPVLLTPETTRDNLRRNLHHVVAKLAAQQGLLHNDAAPEITLKTAAYLIGVQAYKLRKEKQAMLEGILYTDQLQR